MPVCFFHAGTCLAAVEKAMADTDSFSVLPLGRQHGLLNVIEMILNKLGHLIQSYLPKLLQIILCCTSSVALLLECRDQVSLPEWGIIDSYPFTKSELDLSYTLGWLLCVCPRVQLKPGCISPLKNLRRLGLLRIQDFFDKFESYQFTSDELDAVFHAVVWPQVRTSCRPFSFKRVLYMFWCSWSRFS